jgi:hypothetical protein
MPEGAHVLRIEMHGRELASIELKGGDVVRHRHRLHTRDWFG